MVNESTSSLSPSTGGIDSDLEEAQALEAAANRIVSAIGHLANDAVWFSNSVADYLETLTPVRGDGLTREREDYLIKSGSFTAEELAATKSDIAIGGMQLSQAETWLSHLCATMSLADVTGFLDWDEEAVRSAVSEGRLYAVEISGRLRFPDWQFDLGSPEKLIPGLSEIIDVVAPRLDWRSVGGLFATPQSSLVGTGRKTPIQWLLDGGDVNAVKQIVESSDW